MDREDIMKKAANFTNDSKFNYVPEPIALSRESSNMKIFEEPIFSFGSAKDEYFKELKDEKAIGEHFMMPGEWLCDANTVISFFLPFTDTVRNTNKNDMSWPSYEWLHGRIEGQAFIKELSLYLKLEIENSGYKCVVPSYDPRWFGALGKEINYRDKKLSYTSNWSERHVAFVCGLGTFGLSKGLITEKGVAGRFGSLITTLSFEKNDRKYKDIYEYCTMCGKCAKNCPASAIDRETGKDHKKCSDFINKVLEKHNPRYGCGKCQVNVPCENRIP